MTIDARIYVIAGILSTALAQISLKTTSSHDVLKMKWAMWLLLSVFAYLVSFSTYYMALKSFEISKVQPIMTASITAIIVIYGFTSGENINNFQLWGVLLSIISIFLMARP